jgi:uncharacterized protein YoxC
MNMVSDVWKFTKALLTLAEDLQRYHAEIKEIRQELRDLTLAVHLLRRDVEHNKDTVAGDIKNLLLQLENGMLKLNNRSPRPK